jgi:hypothetical protein
MLMTSLTKNKIIDLSKEEDKMLLGNVSSLVNTLYENVDNASSDVSIFRKIMGTMILVICSNVTRTDRTHDARTTCKRRRCRIRGK